jgi:Ribosomal protein L11 methyltransferase (PrmA)
VLALMACQAGASRVYAIDRDPILAAARKNAVANGVAGRIEFLRGESSHIILPEPVDVAIADLIGHFAFESGVFAAFTDARARYLKASGRTIPGDIALYAAPIEDPELRRNLAFWRERPAGFDMTAVHDHARRAPHTAFSPGEALLTTPALVARRTLPGDLGNIAIDTTLRAVRSGTVDAVAGWFVAELAPGIAITNAPGADPRIDRRNLVLPVSEPMIVIEGDEIRLSLRVLPDEFVFQWRIERRTAGGAVHAFSASTFEGVLLSRDDLVPTPAPRDRRVE